MLANCLLVIEISRDWFNGAADDGCTALLGRSTISVIGLHLGWDRGGRQERVV